MCCIWASSGFNYYMLDIYVKYFPGNVFMNKTILGACDAVAIIYINLLSSKFHSVPIVIRITLAGTVFTSLLYMAFA